MHGCLTFYISCLKLHISRTFISFIEHHQNILVQYLVFDRRRRRFACYLSFGRSSFAWAENGTRPHIRSPLAAMETKECRCRRWAISLKGAFESDQFEKLYRKGTQCITAEEYERIPEFRHREDALACLFGRLLLRHAAQKFTGCDWKEVRFERTEKGKPYLTIPPATTFGLNVSHQGDYVAFASSCSSKVGVDLMRLDKERNNKTADEYINSMAGSASTGELRAMRGAPTEAMKMTVFYRFWCLKEAILKATGVGMLDDLTALDFKLDSNDRYRPGSCLTSTTVTENGVAQDQWVFEESFIDTNHSAAVCREKKLPRECVFRKDAESQIFFSQVKFATLLENAEIINPLPSDGSTAFEEFMSKPRKTF